MFIQFKYKVSDDLKPLMMDTITNYHGQEIDGWMNTDDVRHLRHCSLYLICNLTENESGNKTMSNATAIVAKNSSIAVAIFTHVTKREDGTLMTEIVSDCSKIKVTPTGIVVE